MLESLKRRLKPRAANPFRTPPGHLVMHCCHHRVGTNWFLRIFEAIGQRYGLPFHHNAWVDALAPAGPPAALLLDDHSHVDRATLPANLRGSHLVRDPRDMVVSGYHYHLWCDEPWATTPLRELGDGIRDYWPLLPVDDFRDLSYRDYLNTLDPEAGMEAELLRASSTDLADLAAWGRSDPRFLELRYEDLLADEPALFRRLFEHYGFSEAAVEDCLEIAEGFSFNQVTRRKLGEVASGQHLRSGAARQWETAFTPTLKRRFKALHGELLIELGYEDDLEWCG